uniref:C2H2-type domain-containing protein n=1 Tax=Timema cristinae TaxID=61476 RepID=A0A7R9CB11_TIMCR|nr:unnamed protein product [Timema cristinae]
MRHVFLAEGLRVQLGKVKSQEILKILETSGQSFTRDQETKILKCEICEVVVNSSQQLQTHLAGACTAYTPPFPLTTPTTTTTLP